MAVKPVRRDHDAEPDACPLHERLRADLARLGLAAGRVEAVASELQPVLRTLSVEAYAALLAGVAAAAGEAAGAAPDTDRELDIAGVERLMHGVREEVQKLDEGLRMLSAYVTGLRRTSHGRVNEPLH
jgi:hypothetical protein